MTICTQENKALVARFIEEVLNEGKAEAIDDYCLPGSMFAGGLAHQLKVMKTAFPDHCYSIDLMLAEGDRVVVGSTMRATNTGPLGCMPIFGKLETPVPPTGKAVMSTSIAVFTVRDGKIVSMAQEFDQIGILRQLGWTFSPPAQQ